MSEDEGRKKSKGGPIIWGVLGLLILSLGGFGIGGFGGEIRTVAEVGDQEVLTGDYARALQQEQRTVSQSLGTPVSLDQLRLFGRNEAVMNQLLAGAAIAHESAQVGLSVGDAEVASRIRNTSGFQGLNGFDREGYAFALRQAGLNERQYEDRVRSDAARGILEAAIVAGVQPPAGYAKTLVTFLAETRDATLAQVTATQLQAGAVAPTQEQLEAFRTENEAQFQTPELRNITVAWISPDTLAASIDVAEDRLQDAYDLRADQFRLPPRVLAERLIYSNQADAEAALARIDGGEVSFDDLVEERGLTLADADQGELSREDLDAAIADALFALEEPGIVGPVETQFGPALYRVNALLAERITPLEDVREDLSREVALDQARRDIDAEREAIDDLLAGGATLEELADETVMEVTELAWHRGISEGVAGYGAFRGAAAQVSEDDFPELEDLADGGLFALRLNGIDPAVLPPLADIRAEVEAAWQSDSLRNRLLARAEDLASALGDGESFESLGLTPESVTNVGRDGTIPDAPRAVVTALFDAEEGSVFAVAGDDIRAYLIQLDAVNAADFDDPGVQAMQQQLETQAREAIMVDLFQGYGLAAQTEAGFSVNAQAVQAVEAQLLGGGHGQ